MAHYAFLDNNNIVTEVIVGIDETELIEGLDPETWYGNFRGQTCKRTSYNGNIRKNYAGIGYSYDETRDAFIATQPFESWLLNEDTCQWQAPKPFESWVFNESTDKWQAPTPYPTDNKNYCWNEDTLSWNKDTPNEI